MNIRMHTVAWATTWLLGMGSIGLASAQGMGPGAMMGSMQGGFSSAPLSGEGQVGSGAGMGPMMMSRGSGGMGPGMMAERAQAGGQMGASMMGGMMACPMLAGGGGGMLVPGRLASLGAAQSEPMRESLKAHRLAQFERKAKLLNLHDDLMAEMHAPRPDPERVRALHREAADLHGDMMAEMVRLHNAMQDLLDPSGETPSDNATDHSAHH